MGDRRGAGYGFIGEDRSRTADNLAAFIRRLLLHSEKENRAAASEM